MTKPFPQVQISIDMSRAFSEYRSKPRYHETRDVFEATLPLSVARELLRQLTLQLSSTTAIHPTRLTRDPSTGAQT